MNTEQPKKQKPKLMTLAQDIWRQPRAVIRQVVDYDPWLGQREIILCLSGVSGLLAWPLGVEMMILEVTLNFVILILSIYSMAWLLWLTGKPMGGKASIPDLCASMTWPMVPAIWGTVLALPLMGNEFLSTLLQGLLYLYSFHLMVETVAEVQGFAYWRSFFNQLFALIISLLPILFFWQEIKNMLNSLIGLNF